nr:U32 family peptidase [Desulfobulbaceae bacterium]
MRRKIELLAPGGDIDSIKAAIVAGANAIYCGLDKFNARNRAENITINELSGIVRAAHSNGCEVFVTLNIIIVESEIPALISILNRLINTRIDGVIVQDLGMFYLLSEYFPGLTIHASTQLTTHNEGQIKFLAKLNAARVNLCRELSLKEIKALTQVAHENSMLTEVFVHGANCLSFSGLCYLSSVHGGNSGNRGRCSQPCRDQYETTPEGKDFPLNLKDNSAYFDLKELSEAGVDSVKIEGRIKKFHYVHTVVNAWRKQLDRLYAKEALSDDNSDLHKVFNRDFSNAFLMGDINRSMFIDNPRDNSALHRAQGFGGCTAENIQRAKRELYDLKTEIITTVRKKIAQVDIGKAPLALLVSGESGSPLQVEVITPDCSFMVFSACNLENVGTFTARSTLAKKNKDSTAAGLNYQSFFERFKAVNDTEYFLDRINLDNLQPDLFIPFKELTSLKNQIVFHFNGAKEIVEPIAPPIVKRLPGEEIKPVLSVLIASREDLPFCRATQADIYYQLPNSFTNQSSELLDIFRDDTVIPWFPSVLIGEDYRAAVEFLHLVQPKQIVTNNTGIAYEAWRKGFSWIAGPHLNLVNSFSLLCLKEKFNCYGAFVSNEINRDQIKRIKKPADFKLYYSIYHPLLLLTSRQCLFHQVVGCKKSKIDDSCILDCEKSVPITNVKKIPLIIEKSMGNLHSIYNEADFLNTDIVSDLPNRFSSFFIDLRGIKTGTKRELDKSKLIMLFERHINGDSKALDEIRKGIHPTTSSQYEKGI